MTNTEVIGQILVMVQEWLAFMLPVIAFLAALHFLISLLLDVLGFGRSKSFWG